ncbi:MAG: hypothetical protein LC126_06725 [Bryobacterales bacterium]|nr:hypothetical protein [Bryobacterales bacterium]
MRGAAGLSWLFIVSGITSGVYGAEAAQALRHGNLREPCREPGLAGGGRIIEDGKEAPAPGVC